MEYSPWLNALKREVEGLALTSAQMGALLQTRTSGPAHDIVQHTRVLYLESSPEHALQHIQNALDKRFRTTRSPSQQLLYDLTHGPTITTTDSDKLFLLAHNCNTALELRKRDPTVLASLEETSQQDNIINRLGPHLYQKWHEHHQDKLRDVSPIPFNAFELWIDAQATLQLRCQNNRVYALQKGARAATTWQRPSPKTNTQQFNTSRNTTPNNQHTFQNSPSVNWRRPEPRNRNSPQLSHSTTSQLEQPQQSNYSQERNSPAAHQCTQRDHQCTTRDRKPHK